LVFAGVKRPLTDLCAGPIGLALGVVALVPGASMLVSLLLSQWATAHDPVIGVVGVIEITYEPGGYTGEHHPVGPGIRFVAAGESTFVTVSEPNPETTWCAPAAGRCGPAAAATVTDQATTRTATTLEL
jgi:hypothetical protein